MMKSRKLLILITPGAEKELKAENTKMSPASVRPQPLTKLRSTIIYLTPCLYMGFEETEDDAGEFEEKTERLTAELSIHFRVLKTSFHKRNSG